MDHQKLTELDLAELRLEMRRLYKEIGFTGCLQVMYEILASAQVLMDVIFEEKHEENKKERLEP